MSKYLIAVAFAISGVGLGVVNVWNNSVAINSGSFLLNDLTMMVSGLAIVSAMLALALGAISQKSMTTAALAVVVIAGCTFTSVGYTLARVGSIADRGVSAALAHNARIKRLTDNVDRLRKQIIAERNNGGCGKNCRDIKQGQKEAQALLASLGSRKVVDSAGERLEAITGGWLSADRYRTSHPVVTAATLELGVSLLLFISGMFAPSGNRRNPGVGVIEAELIDVTPADPVEKLLRQHRRALTNGEIASALGVSAGAASQRVARLVGAGRVQRDRIGRKVQIKLIAL